MHTVEIMEANGARETLSFTAPMKLGDLLRKAGKAIPLPCAGRGTCGACRVQATGALSRPNAVERAALPEELLARGIRLACQAEAHGDVAITLIGQGEARIVSEGALPAYELSPWATGFGVAVDIGTTTLAAYLYDLGSGERLASRTAVNPQAPYGADVLSRMEKAEAGEGKALQRTIADGVAALIAALCTDAGRMVGEVQGAVITGNTAMLYLLTDEMPSPIMRVPFTLNRPFGEEIDPGLFGLGVHARVYLPRCIAAYVGGDITTALLAAGLYRQGAVENVPPTLFADIGTNGELVLSAGGRLYACSTAAGPALEGVGIRYGMPAQTGAITHMRLKGDTIEMDVLGDKATGICGSGIVDAVAVMLEAGIIDETGVIEEEGHTFEGDIVEVDDQPALRLPGCEIVITQADVRAVQLCKAAICAGLLALLGQAGLTPGEVPRLLIAGGLGSNIGPEAAERIGLIPEGFAQKTTALGNAAGMGASLALLSGAFREDCQTLPPACEIVELATNPLFMAQYVEQMMFS